MFPAYSFCEIQTITHTVKQPFGGSQSPDDARIAAIAKAKREALEMAGVYIESLTVVKNSKVDKDEILALAAGVLKAEVMSQENYHTKEAFGIEVVVKVVVDPSVLESRVKKLLQDRTHLDQLNQARIREKELLEKIALLEKENRKGRKSDKKVANLKKEFQAASRGLTAVEWLDKAFALWADGEYNDPAKAMEYLNEAIHLKPDYADAYGIRGDAYENLGQYQQAIRDYDKVIRLKPDYAEAYNNRGIVNRKLKKYQRAIQDYDKAIHLKPNYADAYYNRAIAYENLGKYEQAIGDYDKAIRLAPDDASAYYNRGNAYVSLMGQHEKAIRDFDQAIRLKPDHINAHANRGISYIESGNSREGCRSLINACELGNCFYYERAKRRGDCR